MKYGVKLGTNIANNNAENSWRRVKYSIGAQTKDFT